MNTPLVANRQAGIDRLRSLLTALVIVHHTSITYGGAGSWYWHDPTVGYAKGSSLLLSLLCAIDQAWFMGAFFFLAAYFTPAALARKGPTAFATGRLLRLGVPTLVYGFLLGPLTIALARVGIGEELWPEYRMLLERGSFEIGPMWFAWALLLFGAATLAWQRLRPLPVARQWPGDKALWRWVALITALAFALRLIWPVGRTYFGNLQLGYFASYLVLYCLGCAAANLPLDAGPARQARRWRWIALLAFPLLILPGALGTANAIMGGWSWEALLYAAWEPLVGTGILLTALRSCGGTVHRRWSYLGSRAYAVFIIHPPVVVLCCQALQGWYAPPLFKFAVAGSGAIILCWLLADLLVRLPGVRRVL